MSAINLLFLSLLLALPLTPFSQDQKSSVPTEFPRRKLVKELKDLFKEEFGKRDVESRKNFAKKLLVESGTTADANRTSSSR